MKQSEYIAVLDLGTSKILGMVASKSPQGILNILATEKVDSSNCIRRGYVYNMHEAVIKVSMVIDRLNEKLDNPIEMVYVGIGGQSIHSHIHTVKRSVSGTNVRPDLIDLLLQECKVFRPDFTDVLDIVSPEYYLDGRLEPNPVGVICESIEAKYQLILGKSSLKSNLEKCIAKTMKVKLAGFFISPLATAEAVLTQTNKELGCALVEFGAGITSVSVYKRGFLHYLVTIPLGGDVITKDICDMNVLESEAEILKKEGVLLDREIDESKLETIIVSRCEEIVDNVIEQIKQSGYYDELGQGIIVTGGAAAMSDFSIKLIEKTGMDVRTAMTKKSLINTMLEEANDPSCATAIGLLALGTENCAKIPVIVEEKIPVVEQPIVEQPVVKPGVEVDIFGNPIEPNKKEPGTRRKPVENADNNGHKKSGFFSKVRQGLEKTKNTLFSDDEYDDNNNEE